MSTTIISSGCVTAVCALFCFIAYGTLGWSTQFADIDGTLCDYDYKIFVGLYKYREEIDTDCSGGSSSSETHTGDSNCDDLSSDQCDLLEGAQSAAGTAVAAAVLLIIAQILLLLLVHRDRKMISTVLIVASCVIAVILGITSFTACGNWKDLIDDISDDLGEDWDVDVGYSWYLMLFSGLFGMGVAAISVIIFCQERKNTDDLAHNLM